MHICSKRVKGECKKLRVSFSSERKKERQYEKKNNIVDNCGSHTSYVRGNSCRRKRSVDEFQGRKSGNLKRKS